MAASIGFGKDGKLYGVLAGTTFVSRVTNEKWKRWNLHLYSSEKGRNQGILNCARHYPGSDLLKVDFILEELVKVAKLATVIPKELPVYYDMDRWLREKAKEKEG